MSTGDLSPCRRLLTAIHNQAPDDVPATPDISNMVPCRLTGKPFWGIYYHDLPTVKAIKAAGEGGGFILSTGDQRGRDTPDANLFAMVQAAEQYER